ncbi:hypothetical protein MW290_14885 [Aquincola tertiaricarbonis]|uniref:Uncharacterized protein n=1 Tax=Aquincola tertiaricarbonis TaxID=391953 RepID=A0ABY4SCU4_AQUTE|nr:hypothetical protein [Aquincola tertiaricarbonis]URI10299.1 hypothetical protein MW290_14885 [Aquincola tertiaricarbonis]
MSTTSNVFVPRYQATPRGAKLVGLIVSTFTNIAERRRAAKMAAVKSVEAEEVRRYARGVARHDPGFAADLFAAADRHTGN